MNVQMSLEEMINKKEKQVKTKMNGFLKKLRKDFPNFNRIKSNISINTDKYKLKMLPDGKYLIQCQEEGAYKQWNRRDSGYPYYTNKSYYSNEECEITFKGLYGKDHNLLAIGNNKNAELEIKDHGYHTIKRTRTDWRGTEEEEISFYNEDNKELVKTSKYVEMDIFPDGKIKINDYSSDKHVKMLFNKKGRKLAEIKGDCFADIQVYNTKEYAVTTENQIETLYTSSGRKIAQTKEKNKTIKPLGKGFYAIQFKDKIVKCEKPPEIKTNVYDNNHIKIGEIDFLAEKICSDKKTLEIKGYKYRAEEEGHGGLRYGDYDKSDENHYMTWTEIIYKKSNHTKTINLNQDMNEKKL